MRHPAGLPNGELEHREPRLAFEAWHRATWWFGASIGFIHGLRGLRNPPSAAGTPPSQAKPSHQSDAPMLLEPPGFMALNYGRKTPILTVLAHVVYGAILGAFYQLTPQ
jgi:hypothetical protein